MEIRLSEFIEPLRGMTQKIIARDFSDLVNDGLMSSSQAQEFNRVLNDYPFEIVNPPEQEYWSAIGTAVNLHLREKVTKGLFLLLPLDKEYDHFSREMIDSIYIKSGQYQFGVYILIKPDPISVETTTYICLCVDVTVSCKNFFLVPINLFIS